MPVPERPSAPNFVKVTHYSIELTWEESLSRANEKTGTKGKGKGAKTADKRVSVQLEQKETNGDWINVYTGYAKSYVVDNLKHWEPYFFRIRFSNEAGPSDWSPEVVVTTSKKPLTGEDIHSAIFRQNLAELERILETREAPIDATNRFGQSPLMVAAEKGYTDMLEVLIDNGADVNFQNEAGKTALMLAAYGGQSGSVELLLRSGANLDLRDRGGSSALHWAADSGKIELIDWMIEHGADHSSVDLNRWTPLLKVAAVGGSRDVAALLLRRGADVNWKDKDGKTALMMAVINSHLPLVQLLTEKDVDITVKNEFGKTAYEMALSMDKVRIIKTLESYMDKKGIKYMN